MLTAAYGTREAAGNPREVAMEVTGSALVTGASRGIGRAIALELAARGFDVVATMRNPDDGDDLTGAAAALGGRLRVQRLDVTDPTTYAVPNDLQVLVNNAGIEFDYVPVEHSPVSMWRAMFDTNVFGLLELTQQTIPVLRANGGGVICNVTSSSILAPMPFYAAYRASKAAVSVLGESLRSELAPFNIRVVEIMPGPIDTDMFQGSKRPLEAGQYAEYRAMAEKVQVTKQQGADNMVTSTADAAAAIGDAIFDDDGPLRYGCDPLAVGMIDGWRQTSDEEWMRMMMGAFAPDAS